MRCPGRRRARPGSSAGSSRRWGKYLRTISRVGRWLPAHAGALGKALLAEHPDAELPDVPYEALTPRTHTTRAALVADLAQVRDRGYSIDREEGVTGIVGFGFALRVNGEAPAGDAISCSVPVARLTEERERRIVSVMQKVREEIEARRAQGAGRRAQGVGVGGADWR